MIRRLIVLLSVLALVAAACGDDDADTTGTETGEAPPMGPAELTAEDQSGDGTEVVVASVTLPADGFVVIHADADGSPGPVIGHTELLSEGESTDVAVPLDEPLAASATVWPMAHIDTNTNGEYDFAPPDVTDDGPATFDDGSVAVISIEYEVEGGGGGSAASVTIQDFAFAPDTIEVAAGSTITWTNEDGVTHTVTAGEPGNQQDDFDETVNTGAEAEITFDDAGTFAYFCSIHPNMTAEVVVS